MTLSAKSRAVAENRQLDVVAATNLTATTDDMLRFCADHGVLISTSLDGPEWLHDRQRIRLAGASHALFERRLEAARRILGEDRVSALMTTTRASLEHPEAIVDEYVRLGFRTVFLRPLRAFGFAAKAADTIGYDIDRFLGFWKRGLHYIIELNKRGIFVSETFSRIILTEILTPFSTGYVDLQSPPGIGSAE